MLWRQLTTAARSPASLVGLVLILAIPPGSLILFRNPRGPDPGLASLGMLGALALFVPAMITLDFRPDIDRMEYFKTLPFRPVWLVLGQLLAPVVLLSVGEWVSLLLVAAFVDPGPAAGAAAALLPPCNLLLVAVENLFFLLFPYRLGAGANSFDFQLLGRQLVVMSAKSLTLVLAVGAAGGAGALAYLVTGGGLAMAVAVAWVVVAVWGLAAVPAVAWAFTRFDVTRDRAD
jgi:hypothetical protein